MTIGENAEEDKIEVAASKSSNIVINPKAFRISIEFTGKEKGNYNNLKNSFNRRIHLCLYTM